MFILVEMERAGKVRALEENYITDGDRATHTREMCRPALVIYVIVL